MNILTSGPIVSVLFNIIDWIIYRLITELAVMASTLSVNCRA